MIILMEKKATEEHIDAVIKRIKAIGFEANRSNSNDQAVITLIGEGNKPVDEREFSLMPGVSEVAKIKGDYQIVTREFHPENTIVKSGNVEIGGKEIIVMAGPCSVENEEQINIIARSVKDTGARILRGGAFKPRTSPYSFQGLGIEGLKLLSDASKKNGIPCVSEVMDPSQIESMMPYIDIFQVGARNMQNFTLLKELGQVRKPVLLKRGISATIKELLSAAEYILAGGNFQVILCERGIRTFETYTRNTMDLSSIPIVQKLSHLPIIADPSHGTGIRDKVLPMARAAVAAGADGLLIEVHHCPEKALSDGAQSVTCEQFVELMDQLRIICQAIGRTIAKRTFARTASLDDSLGFYS